MESCEGDSGVGSDMVNPQEREDQAIDDQVDQFDQPDKEIEDPLAIENDGGGQVEEDENDGNEFRDPEDPEERETLANCRETIENLRKLGEHSR